MKETCLKGKESEFPTLEEVMRMVGRIKFCEYDTDFKPEAKDETDTENDDNINTGLKVDREVLVE